MDIDKELFEIRQELDEVKKNIEVLKVGYAETKLNLALCRGIGLVLSALNFLQLGIK